MSYINDQSVSWEIVRRWGTMLDELPDTSYEITLSFSLFSSILTWVLDQARLSPVEGETPDDRFRRSGFPQLTGPSIRAHPWSVIGGPDVSVGTFLSDVRNAIAHSDGRRVVPHNCDSELVGFRFFNKNRSREYHMSQSDMKCVGKVVAAAFSEVKLSEAARAELSRMREYPIAA